MSSSFKGFADGKSARISVPAAFFTEVLPNISDLDELRVSLILFCLLENQNGPVQYVLLRDLLQNKEILQLFGPDEEIVRQRVGTALQKALSHGIFLIGTTRTDTLYLLHTPRARAAVTALQKESWLPGNDFHAEPIPLEERPNIYQIYEANIGPLTPLLAQILDDAEKEYSSDWIEEAIKMAVKKNIRNWNYVEAILRSWKEKGRGEKDQRNNQENPRKYIEGDLADYIKH